MKAQIKSIIEKYLLLRPFLWGLFILNGERTFRAEKKEMHRLKNRVISEVEKSQLKQIHQWNEADKDKTLRFVYPLNEYSTVFDVGGFEGNWAAEISARYGSTIHIFEPVIDYFEKIDTRFKGNKKIIAHPFGLGKNTEEIPFFSGGDWSSTFERTDIVNKDNGRTFVQIKDIVEFIEQNNITSIDLIKINIEGGEFDLLERLIQKQYVGLIQNILVQFHNIDSNAKNRMNSIQEELSKTHVLTYQFEFIWENWKKID